MNNIEHKILAIFFITLKQLRVKVSQKISHVIFKDKKEQLKKICVNCFQNYKHSYIPCCSK